jgi:CheY-like chemotaxis protein
MLNKTVLIVDDLVTLRQPVRFTLERAGYVVEEAENGREALSKIAESRPDLVLLDLMMPRMNGVEVLERLRASEATKDIPVIVLTAVADRSQIRSFLNSKTVDYLLKPFTTSTLLERVRRVLGEDKRTA